MDKYILVIFYPLERDNGKTVWLVYGYEGPGIGDSLGEYSTKHAAIDKCFSYGVPVMQGRRYDLVLEKLVEQGSEWQCPKCSARNYGDCWKCGSPPPSNKTR